MKKATLIAPSKHISSKELENAVKILKKLKYNYAVTTEPRPLGSNDSPLELPRFDTNDIRDYLNKN